MPDGEEAALINETPDRDPKQFRLFVVLGLLTLTMIATAVAKQMHGSQNLSVWQGMQLTLACFAYAIVMYYLVERPAYDSALVGGWLGVILGGGMLGTAWTGGHPAYQESLPLVSYLFAGLMGVVLTSTWSPLGLAAAWLVSLIRKRHDAWSGLVCGIIVGIPISIDQFRIDPGMAFYILLLGACGGWGAATQTGRVPPRDRKDRLPTEVDEFACRTVARHPKPAEQRPRTSPFRVRVPLRMPARLRHWWPF